MRLAVIPARGGSKRIPCKNIREFCGKPIIAWSIEAAIESDCFDRVIVSTDNTEIARIAEEFGANVPFLRPKELADDYAGTTPVIKHAIQWHVGQGVRIEAACCIYATAPFCQTGDLHRGLKILEDESFDYVFPVAQYSSPIQRAMRITQEGCVQMFQPECFSTRSQDLEPAYHDAGQWYWGTCDSWISDRPIFSSNSRPLVLPEYRVCDIDTVDDWKRAELMFQALRKV